MSKQADNSVASRQEKHKQLYETLKEYSKEFFSFEIQNAMVILVIAGWILTAEHAQKIFWAWWGFRLAFTVSMLLLTGFHAAWVFRQYKRSNETFNLLEALKYMPAEYFDSQRIRLLAAKLFCAFHLGITLVAIFVVWNLPKPS